MIAGLDKFREHFANYQDQYLLIGGAAAWLLLDEAGLDARATKDLDIVLAIEVLDPRFAAAFWDFVVAGDYEICQKGNGERTFYRFAKPQVAGYPVMLELFSRVPDELKLGDGAKLTPIPVSEGVSSLSAILLDDAYYDFCINIDRCCHTNPSLLEGKMLRSPWPRSRFTQIPTQNLRFSVGSSRLCNPYP